ncbi:MAG: glycosyltransferase family 4 protein [Bacteroidota bacterium]
MENKKLNILFLCSWYPNPDEKSNGIFIKRHAQALSLSHNVTVVFVKSVSTIHEPVSIKNEEENFEEYLYFYPKMTSGIPIVGLAQKFLKLKAQYRKAINRLPATSFDIIHINTIFPAAIPALYAIKKYPAAKVVITEHWSGYYPEDGNYKGKPVTYYTQKLVAKANAILVISEKLKQAMLAHGLKGNYHRIHNVVDVSLFKPVISNTKTNNILNILHVSSLVEREKNISGIIEIARELKNRNLNFHLTFVGENKAEINAHKMLVQKYNLQDKITFVGFKTPPEVADCMNDADVFLLFSHYEGMPVVVLEALSCGLPVISTNVGEVKNMIKPEMGIVLDTASINECANALTTYKREHCMDKDKMNQYIATYYSPQAVCKEITGIYKQLL